MSLAHELRVIDIESQIELLDRLRLLTRFGSNFTTITGEKGSGKSWIAQRYLEAWAQDKNQCLLMCHPNQSDVQKRTILLNQVVSAPLFNEKDPIPDSFFRLIQDQPCDIVIVVDDAHFLSEVLVAELWMLVQQAQANPAWSVNVVLFSQTNSLDSVLTRLSYGQEVKPLQFEIEPFSSKEVELFMELLVLKYVSGEDIKKKVRRQMAKAAPLPGVLIALGERKVEKRVIIRAIVGSPMKIAALILILLLLIGAGYLWLFNQPLPGMGENKTTSTASGGAASGDQMVLTADGSKGSSDGAQGADNKQGNSNGGSDASANGANTNGGSDGSASGQAVNGSQGTVANSSSQSKSQGGTDGTGDIDPNNDMLALPPAVNSSTATVGQSDDGKRVIVPSNVVDALLENAEVDTQIIDDAVADAKRQAEVVSEAVESSLAPEAAPDAVVSGSEVSTTASSSSAAQPVSVEETATQQPVAAPITFSFAREELLAVSDRNYTLQLAAMQSMEDVQGFLNRYELQDRVRVYATVRNGADWYIVTYKDYDSIQGARDAKQELSEEAQALDPFAKSMLQVHREIARAN